uniref:Ig-like domain-containing protein n=1 Tax=Periophthalmus magnuspinnatus TaxID=409849 RepID=A0A3B4B0N1_9GOBI
HFSRFMNNRCTPYFCLLVSPVNHGKIRFTQASLRSSSITVANLTWADESCYVCLFNAYPSGSKLHQTCLKLSGESENKDSHVVFSCSATGKPAPKIQWEYSQDVTVVAKSQTLVLTNDDQSLTSSRNLTLQLYPDWSGDVHCLINPGTRGERKQSITYTRIKNITKNGTCIFFIFIIFIHRGRGRSGCCLGLTDENKNVLLNCKVDVFISSINCVNHVFVTGKKNAL